MNLKEPQIRKEGTKKEGTKIEEGTIEEGIKEEGTKKEETEKEGTRTEETEEGEANGRPMFTRSALITLIAPLFVEQVLSVAMGMADTMMVSGVGEAAVSSVSLVDSINVLILQVLAALATGGAVVASQYLGRKDSRNARHSAAQLYSVLAISASVTGVVCLLFSRQILRWVFGGIDDSVMHYAQQYFIISAVSYPFIGLYNGGAALFRAQGNSRISMLASLVMNIINIGGNAILIYGFGLGVVGAALATLLGRVFAAVWILRRNQQPENPLRIAKLSDLRPRRDSILRVLSIGVPTGFENGIFQIGKLCVSSLTSTLGTAAIAANAVAGSISTLANIPGNTVSLAVVPVVGQCLGAGEKRQAKRYALQLLLVSICGLAVTNVLLLFLAPTAVTWFHLSPEAGAMCITVLRWFDLFSILFWSCSFTLPNVLRCGGDAKFTMGVSVISMWLFRVILSYFFVLQLHSGLLGVWLGMFIDWIFRSSCFILRFRGGKWMEHRVI